MTGIERGPDGLPVTTEKELAAIETLLCDPKYRIKEPGGFLRANRRNLLNPDFVLYTLKLPPPVTSSAWWLFVLFSKQQ